MSSLRELQPFLREYAEMLFEIARRNDLAPQVTSVLRSRAYQQKLYDRWLKGLSKFPAAKPGSSKHELGLAFDMTVHPLSMLKPLGEIWESWGGTWGGRFKDPIHFDYRGPIP